MPFTNFIQTHPPSADLRKADTSLVKNYEKRLPVDILDLWTSYGFGDYSEGLLRLINPDDYNNILYEWLNKKDMSRIPILITAFGEIFYYRDLGITFSDEGDEIHHEDFNLLDVHFKNIEVCTWSSISFFEDYLCDENIIESMLRKSLFEQSVEKSGRLAENECFYFVPALALGGTESIECIAKGDMNVQLSILFQL